MRRGLARLAIIMLFVLLVGRPRLIADSTPPLTNDSILQLVAWHVSDTEIISVMTRDPGICRFDLSPQAVSVLKAKGVPGDILVVMQECQRPLPAAASKAISPSPSLSEPSQPALGATTDAVHDRMRISAATTRTYSGAGSGAKALPKDQVVLSDGSIVKGQVLFLQCSPGGNNPTPTSIQFQPSGIPGKAAISASQVQSLALSDGAITLSSSAAASPIPAAVSTYLTLSPSDRTALAASPIDLSLTGALTAACKAVDHYWNGDITLTGAYGVGTQTQKQIGGGLATSLIRHPGIYSWEYQIARLDLEAKYTVAQKVGSPALKSQEIYYGELTYSFYPSSRWSPYGFARLYHNYSLGLGLGQIYGGGVAYSFGGLVVSGGLVGITERLYAPSVPFTSGGARLYESYARVLGTTKITFFESIDAFPSFQAAKAIQGRGVAGFVIPAWSRLQLIPKFGDDYLGNAPTKHRLNYSNTSLSLDFKVGRSQ